MDKQQFEKITNVVIDKLEGGYFHPDMYQKNPKKFEWYNTSGETMFGLDRFAGHDLYYSTPRKSDTVQGDLKYIANGSYTYATPEAKEFWTIIDKAGARKNWPWLHRGGDNYEKLRSLASQIIYPKFVKWSNSYLSPVAREIVAKDPRLTFHFSYAVWNGPGWFKKFASDINKAVASGITDSDELLKIALESRTTEGLKEGYAPNKGIKEGGEKIAKFIDELKKFAPENGDKPGDGKGGSMKVLVPFFFLALGIAAIYTLYKTLKKKK